MKQATSLLPAVYMRGGTSRAIIFRKEDLPTDPTLRQQIFQTALGSPDPQSKQLDGLGGGITSLSKVAILSPSQRAGIDVDYLFVQIEPTTGEMLFDANCGNISSAVGPFAVAEGWIEPDSDGRVDVRIFNENTQKVIRSRFDIDGSHDDYIEISGVAGLAAPILLTFEDPQGSAGKGAFPSGERIERLQLASGSGVNVTLIDVTLPCVILQASELGLTGNESYTELVEKPGFLSLMTEVRVAGAVRMGLCETAEEARTCLLNVPDVAVVSAAPDGRDGITAKFVSCDRLHRAAPVTSSMALAAATRISGTVACGVARVGGGKAVTIHHFSGAVEVAVDVEVNTEIQLEAGRDLSAASAETIKATSILRTARRIMQGHVLLPFAV